MSKIFMSLIALFFISACSTNLSSGRSGVSIPILSGSHWQAKGYPFDADNTAYCVVDGGYNSLRFVLEVAQDKSEVQPFISGTRSTSPGTVLTVNTSSHSFRTSSNELTTSQSKRIIQDIENGETAYLRWAEFHGGGAGRRNFTNQISSKDFSSPYKECLTFIDKQL